MFSIFLLLRQILSIIIQVFQPGDTGFFSVWNKNIRAIEYPPIIQGVPKNMGIQ